MKKLKVKIKKAEFDALPEALQALYEEGDEFYILQLEGVADHPDALNLKNTLDKERKAKKTAEDALAEVTAKYKGLPDDFTVEGYNSLRDASPGDVDERLKEQRERLEKQFGTERTELTGKLTANEKKLLDFYRSSVLDRAIADLNIAAPFKKAFRANFKDELKISFEGDEMIATIDGESAEAHFKKWAATDDGKAFIAAKSGGGGGAENKDDPKGGKAKSGNPWLDDEWNLTQQTDLELNDKPKAATLKAEALKAGGKKYKPKR